MKTDDNVLAAALNKVPKEVIENSFKKQQAPKTEEQEITEDLKDLLYKDPEVKVKDVLNSENIEIHLTAIKAAYEQAEQVFPRWQEEPLKYFFDSQDDDKTYYIKIDGKHFDNVEDLVHKTIREGALAYLKKGDSDVDEK